ncbi:uncharacterized protein METZ01_LOCUS185521 [marine metagenome]|uniref:Uncharacterized protein n=1 Tax=marine metagenome TaxID=408172 RepID=A0A382D4X9_9ZZZZ
MDWSAKLFIGVFTLMVLFSAFKAFGDDDNRINIIQVGKGDNLDLTITQEGFDNNIFFSIGDGDDILLDLLQVGNNNEIGYANDYPSWGSGVSWGGDIDFDDQDIKLWQNCTKNSSCNKNDIQFHVSYGTDNKLWWSQGFIIDDRNDTNWSKDNTEGGGHNVTIDIHGNDNSIIGHQRNCSAGSCTGHSARIYLYGDDNDVFGQQQADGSKEFYLTINNDDNTVDYLQDGAGEHNATITITGSQPTTLDLTQHSNSTQNYTLTQNCVTSGGCTVTVTQD